MALAAKQFYRFGAYRLDVADRLLYKEGQLVPLPPKAFDTLLLLAASGGHVLSKDEMMKELWPDTYVEEGTLAQYISLLRKVLGEDGNWIENFPRRGYRFTAPVESPEESVQAADTVVKRPRVRGRVLAACAIAAAVLGGAAVWNRQWRAVPPTFHSVAVLPFRSASDSQTDYLADGITEALITRLTNLKGLRVVSHSRVRRFRGSTEEAAEIGRQLGVEAVIEGTVRTGEGQIRITVHGVDARTGLTVWAFERREAAAEGLLDLEGQLAESAAQRVRGQITASERALLTKALSSRPEANDLYRKARGSAPEAAEALLKRTVEIDPEFADAHGWLALVQQQLYTAGLGGQELLRSAVLNADRALALDSGSLAAIRALGHIQHSSGRAMEALVMGRRALEEHPDDLDAIAAAAEVYFRVGLFDRAIPLYQKAVDGDPGNGQFRRQLARMYLYQGQQRKGTEALAPLPPEQVGTFGMLLYAESGRKDVALRIAGADSSGPYPTFDVYMKGAFLASVGERADADEVRRKGVRQARELLAKHKNPWTYAFLGMLNGSMGRKSDALGSVRESLSFDGQHSWILMFAAQTHSLLGLKREALEYLRKAVECGFLNLPMIEFHSRPGLAFQGLRNEPEFAALRADMGRRIEALRARQ